MKPPKPYKPGSSQAESLAQFLTPIDDRPEYMTRPQLLALIERMRADHADAIEDKQREIADLNESLQDERNKIDRLEESLALEKEEVTRLESLFDDLQIAAEEFVQSGDMKEKLLALITKGR